MKVIIYTSKYWTHTARFLIIVNVFIVVSIVFFTLINRSLESFIVLGSCALIYILSTMFVLYCVRRSLTKIHMSLTKYQSFLINKKMACVIPEKSVYYMIFKSPEGVFSTKKFILISNSPFDFKSKKNMFSKNLIACYDLHTQILLPFDEHTFKFFDLEKWIKIEK